jgi:superfamily II DNA or RNA helicase
VILRPYQLQAVHDLRRAYASGARRVCYQLPTGAGKTVVFAHLVRGAMARGNSVAILVHRRELLHQASRALTQLRRLGVSIETREHARCSACAPHKHFGDVEFCAKCAARLTALLEACR